MAIKQFLKKAQELQAQAQKRQHEPSSSSQASGGGHDESNWLVSYADMMTLLCGFFILLFSMSKVDAPQYEAAKKSLSEQFGGQYTPPSATQRLAKEETDSDDEVSSEPHPELDTDARQAQAVEGLAAKHAQLQKALTQELKLPPSQAQVQVDPWGISIVLQSQMLFDTLSAELQPQGEALLKQLVAKLETIEKAQAAAPAPALAAAPATSAAPTSSTAAAAVAPALALTQPAAPAQVASAPTAPSSIVIEGYTDSRPVTGGAYASNWELSSARATRVVRVFLDQQIAPNRLVAMGYGDTHPLVPERDALGRYDEQALAKNRRVVIRLLDSKAQAIPLPQFAARALASEKKHTPARVPAAAPVKAQTSALTHSSTTTAAAVAPASVVTPAPITAVTVPPAEPAAMPSAKPAVPATATPPANSLH